MRGTVTGLITGLLVGVIIGVFVGMIMYQHLNHETESNVSQPEVQNLEDFNYSQLSYLCRMWPESKTSVDMTMVKRAIEFMNSELVRPGVKVYLINASVFKGCLYKIMIRVVEGNRTLTVDDIYLTADGSVLALNIAELTRVEMERVNVSAGNNPVLGNPEAEIEIITFSDYADPLTADFELNVLPRIFEKYGDHVKYVFRDFPVSNEGSKASLAANCAKVKGKFWEYHNLLIERQSEWVQNTSLLYDYAEELGIDREWFIKCVENETYFEDIRIDSQAGFFAGVSGTPTVYVNGIKVVGVQDYRTLDRIIQRELENSDTFGTLNSK
jgi:protein-disulfide isomerase